MTTTSASTPRANLARSEDLPTPDPAKRPIRWPRTRGSSVSNTATPVASRSPSRRRAGRGGGSGPQGARDAARAAGGGRPRAARTGSMIRPIQLSSGAISALPRSSTRSPIAIPSPEASGRTEQRPAVSRRTSPPATPSRLWISTRSPSVAASSPATSARPRRVSTTRPTRRTGALRAISARRPSKSPATGFSLCSLSTVSKGITLKPW